MYSLVPTDRRARLREITASRFEETGGNWEAAKPLIRQDIKDFGSILIWLTVLAVLLQIAHTAFLLWKDRQVVHPTAVTCAGEPFEI